MPPDVHRSTHAAQDRRFVAGLLIIYISVFIWSAVRPVDRFTWALEVAPGVVALVLLAATWRRFRFTPLSYGLILVHCVILFVGGHYTYAEVPLFDWLRDAQGLGRNHFDRVGHFAQGFVPAIVAREILVRASPLSPGKWLFFLVTCVCLAASALYELFEWWTAVATGEAADAFLATQGDVWDTQWDMFLALIGAVASQVLLARWHDRQMRARGVLRSD